MWGPNKAGGRRRRRSSELFLFPYLQWGLAWAGRKSVPAKACMGTGTLFWEPGFYKSSKVLWVKVNLATLDPSLPKTASIWENPDPVIILHMKVGRWNPLPSRDWGFVCRTPGQHHRAEQSICAASTRAFMVRLWFPFSWSHRLCNMGLQDVFSIKQTKIHTKLPTNFLTLLLT